MKYEYDGVIEDSVQFFELAVYPRLILPEADKILKVWDLLPYHYRYFRRDPESHPQDYYRFKIKNHDGTERDLYQYSHLTEYLIGPATLRSAHIDSDPNLLMTYFGEFFLQFTAMAILADPTVHRVLVEHLYDLRGVHQCKRLFALYQAEESSPKKGLLVDFNIDYVQMDGFTLMEDADEPSHMQLHLSNRSGGAFFALIPEESLPEIAYHMGGTEELRGDFRNSLIDLISTDAWRTVEEEFSDLLHFPCDEIYPVGLWFDFPEDINLDDFPNFKPALH